MRAELMVATSCLALAGCVRMPSSSSVQCYTGPARPADETATVVFSRSPLGNANVGIVDVDGASSDTFGVCQSTSGCQLELLPGKHTLTFGYYESICEARNEDGKCTRANVWYIPLAPASSDEQLRRCTWVLLPSSRGEPPRPTGCEAEEHGWLASSFEVEAGKFYEAIFRVDGPRVRLEVTETVMPDGPPVQE